ncbi:MAG: hypothetical protein IJP23_01050 [Oscillospiraceae bacterium]|nr:hypothetical protein [Oscillospiraceae bacterium]
MELYMDILCKKIAGDAAKTFREDHSQFVESECYKALKKIKAILEDHTLTDRECFMQIEEIVRVFEEIGSGCGNRHDFG